MSNKGPACFGKLPFNLLESLQFKNGLTANYWADAVATQASNPCLTSIDTVSLDPDRLSNSIGLAIFHSINDIFSANGLPLSISLSMSLPLNTDIDALYCINETIMECARFANCSVGKLHTSRSDCAPTVTVSVNGRLTGMPSLPPKRGSVVLAGDYIGGFRPTRSYSDIAFEQLANRTQVASAVPGPKKDVAGDGLIGTLVQLSKRHSASIEINEASLLNMNKPLASDELLERNYLDYAGLISGKFCSSLGPLLFAPCIFGPIVCLVEDPSNLALPLLTIGSFEIGCSDLRIVAA